MSTSEKKSKDFLPVIIIILFSFYAAAFIYKTSFVVEGTRYFCLFDDAMISMRYAHNLVEGNGLVMNPGERVEGITNPLWTLYMAGVHLFPIPREKISLVIQISAALFLALNLVFVRKIALLVSDGASSVASAAMALTAFYLPLVNWSLQGMEVGVLAFLMSVAVWIILLALRDGTFPWAAYLLLGAGTLIRIDMAVPFIGLWLFMALTMPGSRRKHLVWGAVTLALFIGGQTIARMAYYGDPLPNTYYLKMTGYPLILRLSRGTIVLWNFIWHMKVLWFCVPVILMALSYRNFLGILGVSVAVQMLYSIYVGGDAWDDMGGSNRYIAIVMPMFFILLACGLYRIRDIIGVTESGKIQPSTGGKNDETSRRSRAAAIVRKYYFALLVLLCFIQFNSNSEALNLRVLALIDLPPHIENNHSMVERAQLVNKITTPDAKVAVTWAGIVPYFTERYTVDMLGKTDKTIARLPMQQAPPGKNPYTFFLPGHLKYDYNHSIAVMKPDVVLQFWGDLSEANPYIADTYVKIETENLWAYARIGSNKIRWDLFASQPKQ
jgi:arabinofuranosyltransferase